MKKLMAVVSLIVLAGLIASCGAPAVEEEVEISFWSHDFPPREALDRQYMDKFMEDNPNVTIEYVLGPGDDIEYLTKLTSAMAGGVGPDCFNLLNMSAGRLVSTDSVAPIDLNVVGYESLEEFENDYIEGTLGGLIKDGKLYAMPSEVSNYAMFVNTNMFNDAGLDVDNDMPETWEEMVTLGHDLTTYDGDNIQFRMFDFTYGQAGDATSGPLTLAGMAYQLGGTIFNADETESLVNSEAWVRALQFEQDWVYTENLGNPALTVGFLAFSEGSLGMFAGGSWYGPYIEGEGSPVADNYVVKPLPRFEDSINDTGSFLYAYGLFINAASSPEKQEACMGLIKELSAHPDVYLAEAGLLQPTSDLVDSEIFKTTPFLDVFVQDMEGTPYWPTHALSFEIADVLGRAIQRSLMEEMPPQESLDQAKTEIDDLMNQD